MAALIYISQLITYCAKSFVSNGIITATETTLRMSNFFSSIFYFVFDIRLSAEKKNESKKATTQRNVTKRDVLSRFYFLLKNNKNYCLHLSRTRRRSISFLFNFFLGTVGVVVRARQKLGQVQ